MEEFENEILETPQKEDISSPVSQKQDEDQQISEKAAIIQNFVKNGVLNPQQGQYLMSRLAQKSFERLGQDLNTKPQISAFEEFDKEKPDFFKSDGRSEVLKYLKSSNNVFDKDEINAISDMVELIEKCAIERFVKQQAHEKALNDENEAAKGKLMANAQSAASYGNKDRAFTREQIGRMSGAEFTKYEPLIMEQLRKGLIH